MSSTEEADLPQPRETWIAGLVRLKRGPWEAVATGVIALGIVMLMQPLAIELYTYSFVTILVGTVMFVVVSHFRG